MRIFLGTLCLTLLLPLAAGADPSTSPGYTAKDQAQFAKLAAGDGTWTCVDTPPSKKADVMTAKQEGNWYVTRETGDNPNTTYVRWNHSMQAYVANEVDDLGSTSIATSKSADPFNGNWSQVYPAGQSQYPFTISLSKGTMKTAGSYKDNKTGKIVKFASVCTKN